MSHHSYVVGRELLMTDPPFSALIMAAMRKADTDNARRLRTMWPDIYDELQARYNAPGGYLEGEAPEAPESVEEDEVAP